MNTAFIFSTKIIIQGKEPFRWDWSTILDMLEYSFSDSDRLAEALDTKWVRRVSGFYRCSTEEKGYFANMDWEPANLMYLECACAMYRVLIENDNGVNFLGSDRRGMVFNEMTRELEQLITMNGRAWQFASPVAPGGSKNVFRFHGCNYLMAREFFALVASLCPHKAGRTLMDGTGVYTQLSKLGACKTLDYASRASITTLCFTDNGFMSRHLMQIWTATDDCSSSLRTYIHALLLALLRAKPEEFLAWGVECAVNQLNLQEVATEQLAKVLEEAAQDSSFLRAIIAKKPNLGCLIDSSRLITRMASVRKLLHILPKR